jgi:hypothetical protein
MRFSTFLISSEKLAQTRSLPSAPGASNVRLVYIDGMAAAKGSDLNAAVETEKATTNGTLQDEIGAAIGLQDIRYWTTETISPAPFRRSHVCPDEPAFLLRVASVVILVIEAALLARWRFHLILMGSLAPPTGWSIPGQARPSYCLRWL